MVRIMIIKSTQYQLAFISNFITICAAAVGSTLLVVFKSRCVKISLCFGLWSCDREIQDDAEDDERILPPAAPANDQP